MDDGTPVVMRSDVRDGGLALVATASVAVAVITHRDDAWLVAALILLAPSLLAIAVADVRTHRIPNRLTLVALAIAIIAIAGRAFTEPPVAVQAAVAAVVVGLAYLLLWRFADLGLGDVKLAATLALIAGWSGWQTVVAFVVAAHLPQVPVAVWRLARRRQDRLAFAPGLVIGMYLAVAIAQG